MTRRGRNGVIASAVVAVLVLLLAGTVLRDDPGEIERSARDAADSRTVEMTAEEDARLEGRFARAQEVRHGDATVRVVGPAGSPLEGVTLEIVRPGVEAREEMLTGPDGAVLVRDVPDDGSVSIVTRLPLWGRERATQTVLRPPETEVRLDWGTPVELDPRDAVTGAFLEGVRWRLRIRPLEYASSWVVSGRGRATLPLQLTARALVFFDVEAPDGYVAWDGCHWWIETSARMKSIRVVYPLRREASVTLDVSTTEDGSAVSPVVVAWQAPGRSPRYVWELPDALGRLRVRGVPHLPGAPLTVQIGDTAYETSCPWAPGWDGMERQQAVPGVVAVSARLPRADAESLLIREIVPGLDARTLRASRYQGTRDTTEWRGPIGTRDHVYATFRSGARGTFELEVRDRFGRPAAQYLFGVHGTGWSWVGRLDVEGRVRLEARPVGRVWITSLEPYSTWMGVEAHLVPGETTRVRVREPGGRVEVTVLDPEGHPVPYAYVALEDTARRYEGDALVIDAFTDVRGRWSGTGLTSGVRRFEAWRVFKDWNSHRPPLEGGLPQRWWLESDPAYFEIRDDETAEVTLVVSRER